MAIGERIHHFRLLHGFTQKYLRQQLSFSDMQADVRIALYEKGARSPKEKYLSALAIPDIDSYVGLMRTLFALESLYGLHIGEINVELCLRFDKTKVPPTFLCLIYSTNGRNNLQNWKPARLRKKNMTTGGTTISM